MKQLEFNVIKKTVETPFNKKKKFQSNKLQQLDKIVEENFPFIKNKKRQFYSLKEIVFPNENLNTQSAIIKVGHCLEIFFNKICNEYLISEKEKEKIKEEYKKQINKRTKSGKKKNVQLDLIFEKDRQINYYEIKGNINLDSEKTIATKEKIEFIENILKKLYPKKEIKTGILTPRFPTKKDIPNGLITHPFCRKDFIGYVDFFEMIDIRVTQKEWETKLKEMGNFIKRRNYIKNETFV